MMITSQLTRKPDNTSRKLLPLLPVLLCIYSSPLMAQSFGTLFTEPEEREYMDFLRDEFVRNSQLATFNINEDVIPDIPITEEVVTTTEEIIRFKFGGIMMRINGNRMVWLNDNQVAENDLPGNMSLVETASGTLLNIRANGTSYQIKPGQSLNVQSGVISDSYQSESLPAAATNTPQNNSQDNSEDSNTTTADTDENSAEENLTLASDQDPAALDAILEQLNLDNEVLDDEQRQQVLDILSQQVNQVE